MFEFIKKIFNKETKKVEEKREVLEYTDEYEAYEAYYYGGKKTVTK